MNARIRSIGSPLYNRINSWNLRKLTTIMLILSLAIGLVTAWFWYDRVFLDAERRFWNAINTSMSTPSVVRTLTQGGTGNQVVQDYRFHYSPQQVIENTVEFTNRSATENVSIQTEGIVYPQEQYLRYTQFSNVDSAGEQVSNIDNLLGDWAFQPGQGEGISEEDNRIAYLSEYVTLAVFGNFGSEYRQEVIERMQNSQVYGAQLTEPIEQELEINGQENDVLVYLVTVDLREYATILTEAFASAGYGDFPPLTPENYEEGQTVNGQIFVSKDNGTIVGIDFGGRQERYSNYGVVKNIERPEYNQTVEELQQAVQQRL